MFEFAGDFRTCWGEGTTDPRGACGEKAVRLFCEKGVETGGVAAATAGSFPGVGVAISKICSFSRVLNGNHSFLNLEQGRMSRTMSNRKLFIWEKISVEAPNIERQSEISQNMVKSCLIGNECEYKSQLTLSSRYLVVMSCSTTSMSCFCLRLDSAPPLSSQPLRHHHSCAPSPNATYPFSSR